MYRFNDGVRRRCQKAIDQMWAGDRLRLGAAVTFEVGPNAAEREERPVLIEREPHHILLLGHGIRLWRVLRETVGRRQTPAFWLQPAAPVQQCGARVFDLILKVASGQPTKSKAFDFGGAEFAPWVLRATM